MSTRAWTERIVGLALVLSACQGTSTEPEAGAPPDPTGALAQAHPDCRGACKNLLQSGCTDRDGDRYARCLSDCVEEPAMEVVQCCRDRSAAAVCEGGAALLFARCTQLCGEEPAPSEGGVQPAPDASTDGGGPEPDGGPGGLAGSTGTEPCPDGHERTGGSCADIDECALNTDFCDEEPDACVNTEGAFECACPVGYTGTGVGVNGCADVDECGSANGGCDSSPLATCANQVGSRSCVCPVGYGGSGVGDDGCTDVDECSEGTHDCDSAPDACVNATGSFSCACPSGYTGDGVGAAGCIDIDECLTGNGGCDTSPMATCNNQPGAASTCTCPSGYGGDGIGPSGCTDVDECLTNNGGCDTAPMATCNDQPGAPSTCTCPSGYTGDGVGAGGCTDIDECLTNNGGCDTAPTATCNNQPGAASTCTCPGGYGGDGVGPNGCTDLNECLTNNGGCDTAPMATCNDQPGAPSTCTCPGGYSGDGVGAAGCTDIDECLTNNGGCDTAPMATCNNQPGAPSTCTCPSGYGGDGVGPSGCTDVDECLANNGGCDTAPMATCNDQPGAPNTCTCPDGYTGDGVGVNGCNLDPCTIANGGCDTSPLATCTDSGGGVTCTCPSSSTGGDGVGEDGCTGYQTTFASCPDGWTLLGDWQCGAPTAGPTAAWDGPTCLATLLGNYTNDETYAGTTATSPSLDLAGLLYPELSFYLWVQTEGGFDGANLKISVDGGAFLLVTNVTPAYDSSIAGEAAWNGDRSALGWRRVTADLSAYAGRAIQLRFAFRSDGSVVAPGVYVDAVRIVEGQPPAPPIYQTGFEGVCPSGWALTGDWECGQPTKVPGPSAAYEGAQCLATRLAVPYSNNQTYLGATATSPIVDLPAASAAFLQFRAWIRTEGSTYDGFNLKVSAGGGPFTLVDTELPAYGLTVGGEAAWGGDQSALGWQAFGADLSAYAGQSIRLQFAFRTDGSVTNPGVFIDDVRVTP